MFKISNKINEKRIRPIQILVIFLLLMCCLSSLFASRRYPIDFNTGEEIPIEYHRPNIAPMDVIQPDEVEITLFKNMRLPWYTHYSYEGYTAILDSLTGYWCFADQAEDGWLESTGYPLHLYNGEELGLRKTIGISEERMEELRQNYENEDA